MEAKQFVREIDSYNFIEPKIKNRLTKNIDNVYKDVIDEKEKEFLSSIITAIARNINSMNNKKNNFIKEKTSEMIIKFEDVYVLPQLISELKKLNDKHIELVKEGKLDPYAGLINETAELINELESNIYWGVSKMIEEVNEAFGRKTALMTGAIERTNVMKVIQKEKYSINKLRDLVFNYHYTPLINFYNNAKSGFIKELDNDFQKELNKLNINYKLFNAIPEEKRKQLPPYTELNNLINKDYNIEFFKEKIKEIIKKLNEKLDLFLELYSKLLTNAENLRNPSLKVYDNVVLVQKVVDKPKYGFMTEAINKQKLEEIRKQRDEIEARIKNAKGEGGLFDENFIKKRLKGIKKE